MNNALVIILLLVACSTNAQQVFQMPSLQAVTLDQLFPKYDRISLDSMIKFRQELELFRKVYLEGYNRSLIRHASNVDEASKRLERMRAVGQIAGDRYETYHVLLKEELRRLGTKGDYLQLYYDYLALYQARMKFADQQLEAEKRSRRRAGYGM